MRFSEQWLRELVDLSGISTDELCRGLTLAGLEVDQTHPVANGFEKVVVGRITAVAPHPQADKLQICTVDSGDGDLQIVCGAPNARAGLTAPLALVGASLGSDFTIKPVKLRGVDSAGMLCSARELGLSDDADGLMELPESAPIGTNLRDHLQLDDTAIEIDLTPNRADCLGMIGLAREVGAIFGRQVMATETVPVDAVIEESITIAPATADCPRYLGRVIRDIDMDATTPTWMAERLRRAGLRVISPTVDVTNYVMLELGQPMHAFDLNRLTGQIGVRRARSGENLTLLNDEEVAVNERHLLITDDDRPVALAGVMGGADTAVDPDSTSNILFEAAYFDPAAIVGRARDFGLHTDSSHRFERGVDPRLQWRAMEWRPNFCWR